MNIFIVSFNILMLIDVLRPLCIYTVVKQSSPAVRGSGESSSGDPQNDLDLDSYIDPRSHRRDMYSRWSPAGSGEEEDPRAPRAPHRDPRKEEFLFLTRQFRLDDP